ncbi:MAG: replicative DNA helicase [Clostridia bacterium]|nr:replicative DNA helicase [Clostridia bacterium]
MENIKYEELPHSINCEQELLGGILYNPKIMAEVISEADADDFYVNAHKTIYSALCSIFADGREINMTMIIEEIGRDNLKKIGGVTYLTELMTGGMNINAAQYVNILKEKSYRRKAIKGFYCAAQSLYSDKCDSLKVVENVMNNLICPMENKRFVLKDSDLFEKALAEIDERVKSGGDIPGMETGLTDFDKNVGGLQRGELDIIAGRPSMGKTLFALNLGDGLGENGFNTLLCELEMTEKCIGMRRLSYYSYVEAEKMKFGKLSDDEIRRIICSADSLSKRNRMFTDCTPKQSLMTIRAKAKSIKQSHGLDVIIVDHLNLMSISQRETRDNAIGEVTRGLKILAKELDVCIILICQLSRAVEQRNDKRPMLSDLRESGNIEQDADMVIFLYRDEYYNKYTKEPGIMECIIGKHRNGRIGTLKFKYEDKYQKISDL